MAASASTSEAAPQLAISSRGSVAGGNLDLANEQLPPSLVRYLLDRLERIWYGESNCSGECPSIDLLPGSLYKTKGYLRRRAPYPIEAVLATLDQNALDMISQSFGDQSLNLLQFAEAIVKTGTYDADRVLAFVGGVADLF